MDNMNYLMWINVTKFWFTICWFDRLDDDAVVYEAVKRVDYTTSE